jgi:hypothetical protein
MSETAREQQTMRGADEQRMQLRYGFNEVYGWWHLAQGPSKDKIQRRLRLMGTSVIRVFAFDQPVPQPVKEWDQFAAYLQGVLDAGAKPMVTFAKFHPPYDDPKNIRDFVARCAEIVWSCIENWGGEEVGSWYWCIWNEPNNLLVGGDLTFEQYRVIYDAVASEILRQLGPYLGGKKAMIGGPAIDSTHRLYWMDWIARLIAEVDDQKIGFVSWHRYGDWRPAVPSNSLNLEMWGSPDAPDGEVFQALLMAQVPSYGAHARGVARLLKGRNILNVCGELNTMSHHEQYYTLGLNQNAFGAAYYVSALIHLLRGGADLEMRWTATGHDDRNDAYGLMTMHGDPTPAGLAKQLFAQHVRFGDWIRLPRPRLDAPEIDAVAAGDNDGRVSGVFVNTSSVPCEIVTADWDSELSACSDLFRVDTGTGKRVVRERFGGTIRLNGYGVAAVTNKADIVID